MKSSSLQKRIQEASLYRRKRKKKELQKQHTNSLLEVDNHAGTFGVLAGLFSTFLKFIQYGFHIDIFNLDL